MAKSELAQQRVSAWAIDALMVIGIAALFHVWGWIATTAYWLFRDGLFESQSVGKRLIGLKVVRSAGGDHCTFRDSFIRNVLWVVPVVNVLMALTGLYALFNDPDGRHWGDRLAETRVVRV